MDFVRDRFLRKERDSMFDSLDEQIKHDDDRMVPPKSG